MKHSPGLLQDTKLYRSCSGNRAKNHLEIKLHCQYIRSSDFLSTVIPIVTVPAENTVFIIRFYAIVHRRTIVQNKIINIICSCSFSVRLILIDLT